MARAGCCTALVALCLLFPLPGVLSSQIVSWSHCSHGLAFSSHTTSLERLALISLLSPHPNPSLYLIPCFHFSAFIITCNHLVHCYYYYFSYLSCAPLPHQKCKFSEDGNLVSLTAKWMLGECSLKD